MCYAPWGPKRHVGTSEDSVLVLGLTQETRHLCQLGSPSYINSRNLNQSVLKFSYMVHVFHKSWRWDSAPHHLQGSRLTEGWLCGLSQVTVTVGEEESHALTLQLLPACDTCQFCFGLAKAHHMVWLTRGRLGTILLGPRGGEPEILTSGTNVYHITKACNNWTTI